MNPSKFRRDFWRLETRVVDLYCNLLIFQNGAVRHIRFVVRFVTTQEEYLMVSNILLDLVEIDAMVSTISSKPKTH